MTFVSVEPLQEENDAAIAWFERIETRAVDTLPFLEAMKKAFFTMEKERFAKEGPGWAPLALSTIMLKSALGYPSDTLVRTGNLLTSLTSESTFTTIHTVEGVSGSELSITADPIDQWGRGFASYHQTGDGPRGDGFRPLRPPIEVTQGIARLWAEALREWVSTGDLLKVEAIADVRYGPT